METATAERATAVAHDTRLYELLGAQTRAWIARKEAADYLIGATSEISVDYQHRLNWHPAFVREYPAALVEALGTKRHRDYLPVGTAYTQSKTFTRGEAGVYIVTRSEDAETPGGYKYRYFDKRRVTVADALERVPADHPLRVAYDAADAAYVAATEAVAEHETGYTGWNRYFLVTSSAGHVHRSMACSTCKITTTYAPVVDLSGTTDDEALDVLGHTLCTVCFPEAPISASKISKAAAARLLRERGQ